MTAKSPFFDRYSGNYSAHVKCWECGSQGPIVKGRVPHAVINHAFRQALKRPLQKPLRWQQLETLPVVWLEDVDKEEIIPAFPEPASRKEALCFFTADKRFITAEKSDYGKRWRAWSAMPTKKERIETKWM